MEGKRAFQEQEDPGGEVCKGCRGPRFTEYPGSGKHSQWLRAGEARGRVWPLLTVCVTMAGCLFSGPQFPASQGRPRRWKDAKPVTAK